MAKNLLNSTTANFIGPAAAFATSPIMAQTLGVEGRGAVAGGSAPLLFITAVALFGLPETITYFIARRTRSTRGIILKSMSLLTVAGVFSGLLVWFTANIFSGENSDIVALIQLSALVVAPTILVAGVRALAAGEQRWELITIEKLITAVARVGPMAGFAIFGSLTVNVAFMVLAISPLIGGIVYLALLRNNQTENVVNSDAPVTSGKLLSYSMRVWFGSISGVLLARVDQILMVPLSSTTELGLYVTAVNVSEITLIVSSAFSIVIFSMNARSQDDSQVAIAARVANFFTLIVSIFVAGTMWVWVPILFGQEFDKALPIALVLLGAILVGVTGSVAGATLSARGSPQVRSIAILIAVIVNIAFILLLVPSIGAMGAAVGTFAGNAISGWICVFVLRRRFMFTFSELIFIRKTDLKMICFKVINMRQRLKFEKGIDG